MDGHLGVALVEEGEGVGEEEPVNLHQSARKTPGIVSHPRCDRAERMPSGPLNAPTSSKR